MTAPGRVVRVVHEHQPRAGGHVGRDRLEIGLEAEGGNQGHRHRLGTGDDRPVGVDGVAGVAREDDVTGIRVREVDVGDRLLRAQRGDDLRVGVEADPEARRVERCDRLPERRPPAVRRVLVGVRAANLIPHRVHHHVGCGRIGVADAQRDHVDARRPLVGDLALELSEQVWREPAQPRRPDVGAQSASSRACRAGDSRPS